MPYGAKREARRPKHRQLQFHDDPGSPAGHQAMANTLALNVASRRPALSRTPTRRCWLVIEAGDVMKGSGEVDLQGAGHQGSMELNGMGFKFKT